MLLIAVVANSTTAAAGREVRSNFVASPEAERMKRHERPAWGVRQGARFDRVVVVRLTAIALVGAVLFVIIYSLAVLTPSGQTLGNAALAGQRVVLATGTRGSERILASLGVVSLGAGVVVLVVVALVRRRPRLALATAAMVVCSMLVSELLKEVILPRPNLVGSAIFYRHNTFPSGHATAAAAVGAGLVMVAPLRVRGATGLMAALYSAAVSYSTLFSGWHRPSDVAGSSMIVLVVAASSVAVLVWLRGSGRTNDDEPRIGSPISAVVLLSAGGALMLGGFLGMAGPVEAIASRLPFSEPLEDAAFVAMSTAGVGACFVAAGFLILGLHGIQLDPPD